MIESIYSKENKEKTNNGQTALFKVPKNIRQIGQVESYKKIYVEDYVMTFIRQLAIKNSNEYQITVLLGKFIKIEESRCIFIHGAVQVDGISLEESTIFSNEIWMNIYEEIKQGFTEVEIVGWAIIKPSLELEPTSTFEKIHIDNFAGQDKTLLLYDPVEREEAFYIFEGNHLKRYHGYYIYYEKNEEMQNYMIKQKEEQIQPEQVEDRAIKEVRQLMIKKQEKKQGQKGVLYAAGTMVAVVSLIFGAAALNNYEQIDGVKDVITTISKGILPKDVTIEQTALPEEGKKASETEVEEVVGEITTIKEENIIGDQKNQFKEIETPASTKETEKPQDKAKEPKEKAAQESKAVKQEESKAVNNEVKEKTYYIVKEGDTLASISLEIFHSLSYVSKIQEINQIEDKDKILIGQKLEIPQ